MHAARNFLNLHSSCDYTVTSSLDICQVVPLLLSKFFLYSSWMPLHIIHLIHFLNSNLILHMNLKFLEYHMSVFCLHLSGKLPSSFIILNFLFLLLSTYTFFYTFYFTYMCFLTSSFLYMCLLSSFRMISASFLSWAVTSSSSFMMVNTHSHSSVIRCWCSK